MMDRFRLLVVIAFCTPAFAQTPKGSKLPEGTKSILNATYGEHERQKYDLFVPEGDGPFPLVVWVHGGGWVVL